LRNTRDCVATTGMEQVDSMVTVTIRPIRDPAMCNRGMRPEVLQIPRSRAPMEGITVIRSRN
jgi:hypothetical protein